MIADLETRKLASQFRTQIGIGAKDPFPTKNILSKLNILTVFKEMREDCSGLAAKVEDNCFLLINTNQSIGRQNFTIAHELFHLYYDKNFQSHLCMYHVKSTPTEKKADIFASHLLIPEDGLLDNIPTNQLSKNKIMLDTILKTEHFYSCSRSALLYRLKSMGLIDPDQEARFKENVKLGARIHGYNTDLYNPGNEGAIIGDYPKLARILYDKEVISETNYINYLRDIGLEIEDDLVDGNCC